MLIYYIKIVKQKRNSTCGYVTASMLLKFFQGSNIDENYLLENELFDENGITFLKLLYIYKKYPKGYDASFIREDKTSTLEILKQNLQENIPLQILHLTEILFGNIEMVD
jgi:predicted double-glycine peptidase